jgi:CheY-like chemotaxis protein
MDIMIVDDDPDDIDLFREAVAEINKDLICVTARNGVEALEQLEAYPRLPKCIFLDVNMPLMDGRQTVEALRKNPRYAAIYIVMYSTTHNVKEIAEYAGMRIDFAVKPDSYEQVLITIKHHLDKTGISWR